MLRASDGQPRRDGRLEDADFVCQTSSTRSDIGLDDTQITCRRTIGIVTCSREPLAPRIVEQMELVNALCRLFEIADDAR